MSMSTKVVSEETKINTKVQKMNDPIISLINDPTYWLFVSYTSNGAGRSLGLTAQAIKVPIRAPVISEKI